MMDRRRRLAASLIGAAMAAFAAPAAAQMDPMAEQRCVWACLANSRGASDPAYHACVRARCEGRPAAQAAPRSASPKPAVSQGWEPMRGLAYPAAGICLGQRPCLIVSCPGRGAPMLEFHAPDNAWPTEAPVRLRFGAEAFRATLPARTGPAPLYRWPLSADLAGELKTAPDMAVEVEGAQFRFSLAGSGRAIGGVEAQCR